MDASIASLLSIALGIGLAAAAGFRVFIPLLAAGLAAPASVVAGVVASASVMTDVPASALWPIAIIAGGGIAGLTKGSTALIRAKTGIATLGVGNPVVSTAETVGATGLSILAIVLPILCLIVVLALLIWVVRSTRRLVLRLRADPQK